MDAIKIIVVNWKWDEDLGYPEFIPTGDENKKKRKFSLNPNISWIPSVRETLVIEKEGDYQIDKSIEHEKYVLPIMVDMENVRGKVWKIYNKQLFQAIFEDTKEKFPDVNKIELLFLFHFGNGYEKKEYEKLLQLFSEQLSSNNGEPKIEGNLFLFGHGIGELYGEKGFLGNGLRNFKFGDIENVGWFKDMKYLQFLNQKYFDFIWSIYHFHTIKRLKKFRKWVKLGMTSKKKKPHLKLLKYTQNLLYHLGEWEEDTHKYLQEEGWDFSQCHDLKDWILDEYAAFQAGEILINELKKLAAGTLTDYKELNKTLDQLILSFYE